METKSLGDGFMALFTSANQAIQSATSIQRAIEDHNRANPDMTLSVRMGLNSGDVTQAAGDAQGTAVRRLPDRRQGPGWSDPRCPGGAGPGRTLGDTRIVDRGLFWLKGFPDRWRLFEVLWRDKAADRTGDQRPGPLLPPPSTPAPPAQRSCRGTLPRAGGGFPATLATSGHWSPGRGARG